LSSEAVKRGAEIMGNFPNQDTPFIEKCGRPAVNADSVVAYFLIELGFADTIGISFKTPLQGLVQSFDLALRPLDLSKWPIEWMHDQDSIVPPPASQSETSTNAP
jgi:hypothetical protein